MPAEPTTPEDIAWIAAQLGREPRGIRAIAHRCPCGRPDVVETEARLEDGTPFPTTFYLTCPRVSSRVGTLEAEGVMRDLAAQLDADEDMRAHYAAAHLDYLKRRGDDVPEIAGISAGGMPTRVKCLHALLGHALAAGPGVNPVGDTTREMLGEWWAAGPCV